MLALPIASFVLAGPFLFLTALALASNALTGLMVRRTALIPAASVQQVNSLSDWVPNQASPVESVQSNDDVLCTG